MCLIKKVKSRRIFRLNLFYANLNNLFYCKCVLISRAPIKTNIKCKNLKTQQDKLREDREKKRKNLAERRKTSKRAHEWDKRRNNPNRRKSKRIQRGSVYRP